MEQRYKCPIKCFWDKYKESDYFERKVLVKQLPFIKDLAEGKLENINKDNKNVWHYLVVSQISSYFDDLINYMNNKLKCSCSKQAGDE